MLTDRFRIIAARFPDHVAVDAPPGEGRPQRIQRTYQEVAETAYALAHKIRESLDREAIVALAFERGSPDLYAAQLGVLYAGGAYLCLDSSYPDQRLVELLDTAQPLCLVGDEVMRRRLAQCWPKRTAIPMERFLKGTLATKFERPPEAAWIGPKSLAYVIFTSGTSGRPKAVMLEHAGIENLVASDVERFGLTTEDRCAQGSSPAYDSSVEETWLAFSVGATLVVMDEATTRLGPDLVEWLTAEAISVLCPPPTLLRSMACRDPKQELPHLKLVYVGGEALPTDIADTWGRSLWLENGYGPTECTVTVLRTRIESGEQVSIGFPIPPHQAYILDAKAQPLPPGVPGELCIGGVGLARGYLEAEELTAERFIHHPSLGRLYRTGDLCQQEPDGSYSYFGRIDAQVKVRGHRVELEEVEARLVAQSGVAEAVCAVVDGRLIAGLVGLEENQASFQAATEKIRDALAFEVPSAMRPAAYEWLQSAPRNQSGKLDRGAFSKLVSNRRAQESLVKSEGSGEDLPSDPTSILIAEALQETLNLGRPPGLRADFFHELGGDSLSAAQLISRLRGNELTRSLAVRDVYEAKTGERLAKRARAQAGQRTARSKSTKTREQPSTGSSHGRASPEREASAHRRRATFIQLAVLLGLGMAAAFPLAWLVFVLLPELVRSAGLYASLILIPVGTVVLACLYLPFSLLLLVTAKKCLIGRYQAALIPVWSNAYLRHWVVELLARLVPFGMLQGTVFVSIALRWLGASVGERVHVHRGVDLFRGGWDLLSLGDDVTLSQDCALRLQWLQHRTLMVGPISVETGATLDVRSALPPNTKLGAGAVLGALSTVSPGTEIPENELWQGVPAQSVGPATKFTGDGQMEAAPTNPSELTPWLHGIYVMALGGFTRLVIASPIIAILWTCAATYGLDDAKVLSWLFAPSFDSRVVVPLMALAVMSVITTLLMQAVVVRSLDQVPEGKVSRWSRAYARLWIIAGIVESAGERLSGTLFWPQWLRLAGMRIGRNSEISTITDVIPSRIEIAEECFFADGIYLGGPRIHQGVVTSSLTGFGSSTFLGNHVVIPSGQQLPDELLLGICTVSDSAKMHRRTSWFGLPSFELPRREIVEIDRSLTHDPGPLRFLHRLFWEGLRFVLPIPPLLLALVMIKWVASYAPLNSAHWVMLGWLVTVASLAAACVACALVASLKWILLGRVKPGQHGFWSAWCCRWDFVYVVWGAYARGIMSSLEGTQAIIPWARLMGAKVESGAVLGRGFAQMVDPDMIHIEAGATVDNLFQAHSFEDRVLKIDHVHICANASVGANAVMLYGADIGEGATVAPHSVVMKRERVPPLGSYAGVPIREALDTGVQ